MNATHEQDRPSVTIDDDVALINEQIDALKVLGGKAEVDEDEVYDFSIRWGTALAGRLRRLVHYSSRDRLNAVDEGRFQALCEALSDVSSLIDRFGLAQPVFTDSSPASAKRHRASRRAKSPRGLLGLGRAENPSRPT